MTRTQSGMDENAALAAAKAQGMPWVIVVRATTTPGGHVFQQVHAQYSIEAAFQPLQIAGRFHVDPLYCHVRSP